MTQYPNTPAYRYISLLLLITTAVYANTLTAGFVYDDVSITVLKNPFLHGEVSAWEVLFWDRPLREFTYWLDHALWGWQPMGYHLQNLVWHGANVSLVWLLILRCGLSLNTAFWCALVFAVHPVNTEAVTWVSGRKDLLCLFFELLACLCFLQAVQRQRWGIRFGASLVAFCMALFSKQVAVVLPGLLLLCWWLDQRLHRKTIVWKTGLCWILPFIGIQLVSLLFYFDFWTVLGIVRERGTFYDPSAEDTGYTVLSALLTPCATWLESWQLLLFPYDLVIDREMAPVVSVTDGRWVAGAGIMLGLLGTAIRFRTSHPGWFFGVFWIGMTWFPLSGVLPVGYLLADRYLYIPCVGFCVLAVTGIRQGITWMEKISSRSYARFLPACFNVIVLIFAARTVLRNLDWQDERRLWESAFAFYPEKASIYFNLGNFYWDQTEMEAAYRHWRQALEYDPGYAEVWLNMGIAKKNEGEISIAEQYYRNALSARPRYGTAHYNLAKLLEVQGRLRDAIQHYRHAARYLFGKRNTAQLQALACYHAARLLYRQGDREQARIYIERGLSLSNHHAPSFVLYGMLQPQESGAARDAFLQALEIAPDYGAAYFNLGVYEWMRGNPTQAQAYWDNARSLDPALEADIRAVMNAEP